MSNGPATKRRYTIHPFSERKLVVELHEQGFGSKRIAHLTGLNDSMIRAWIRRYQEGGLESLQPNRTVQKDSFSLRLKRRSEKEEQFKDAFKAFTTTLEPVASIARRYRLDYRTFNYHLQRHRPDLMAERARLKREFMQ